MYLTCQKQENIWDQITPSSLNQHVFLWIQEAKGQWQIFEVDLDYIR